jgi:spore coat protein A
VLTDAHLTIPIREAEVQALPGEKTRMWTYAGSFPGPTVRRPAGHRTSVTFHHQLPAAAGELTVHLHGGHNRTQFDGQPGGLTASHPRSYYCRIPFGLSARASGNDTLIEPGARRTYVYDLMENGAPERAAFQWYHDHRLDHTAHNVWRGLAGMWIIDDELDAGLPLPEGDRDLALAICDRDFDRHNQLTNPFANLRPPADGIAARTILVNGVHMPYHRVSAQRYRLVADFAGARGERVELRSGPRHGARHPVGAHAYVGALMQFRVDSRRVADRTRVPRKLRPLPEWTRRAPRKPQRRFEISIGGLFKTAWLINGRTFNPAYAAAHPKLGTVETWEFVNHTDVAHMMHMHLTDWLLLSRNGKPPPPYEDCLKETFFIYPRERIVVAGHFVDYTGKFVMHCHMLDHEDHGLMSQFEVVR